MSKYCKLEDVIRVIDDAFDSIPMEQTIEILQARRNIRNLPTIEVSEDCISREWVKGICENMLDEEMLGYMLGHIEDAPSVVPKPKEGEMKGTDDE